MTIARRLRKRSGIPALGISPIVSLLLQCESAHSRPQFQQGSASESLEQELSYEIESSDHLEANWHRRAITNCPFRHLDSASPSAIPGQTARHTTAERRTAAVGSKDGRHQGKDKRA